MEKEIYDAIAQKVRIWKRACLEKIEETNLDENSSWEDIFANPKFVSHNILEISEKLDDFSYQEKDALETLPFYKEIKRKIVDYALTRKTWELKEGKNVICLRRGSCDYGNAYFEYNRDKDALKACIVNPQIAKLFTTDLLFAVDYNVGILVASISFAEEFPTDNS